MRYILAKDIQAILQLDGNILSSELKTLRDKRNSVCKLYDDERDIIKGYMIYTTSKKDLIVERLVVDKHYRREGIGTAMMGELIDKLTEEKNNCICAQLEDDNLEGHLFLKSLGFLAEINKDDRAKYDFTLCYPVMETC